MPERSRDANIGRMPVVIGLPFSLMLTVGIVAVIAIILIVVGTAFLGAGFYSLWVLLLPILAYIVCLFIFKKYGEFYSSRIGKMKVTKVKTWTSLHELEDKVLLRRLEKEMKTKGKE
ncbi:hypothetical protein FACS1894121_0450 [Bacteroidia bacterium]|nr:hypothetical protein FACS1894121_0450 [Bacteroidia bacterium]